METKSKWQKFLSMFSRRTEVEKIITYSDGTKEWYLDNKLHRVDGPAAVYPSGTKMWYINGKLHRVDGPAIEFSTGTKEWYLDGKLHRVNKPGIKNLDERSTIGIRRLIIRRLI